MERLVLRREGTRLVAPDQGWCDLLVALPEGVDLNAKITRARSLPQLGTYWGLMKFVLDHGPEWIGQRWLTKGDLSDAIQLEIGFVRQVRLANDLAYAVPRSKSFSECSQSDFNEYFNAALDLLTRWCGFDVLPTYQRWLEERAA